MRPIALCVLTVVAACASAGTSAETVAVQQSAVASERCAPQMSDSLLPGVPVYPECGVGTKAKPIGSPPQLQYAPSSSCARALIDLVVDASGKPHVETARVVRVTDQALASALLAQLPTVRFSPATRDGQPVAQLYRFDFRMQAVRVTAATRGAMRPSGAITC